jgi:transposase
VETLAFSLKIGNFIYEIYPRETLKQWEMYCLDEHVDDDNEVCLIDQFVDSLNLSELGFKVEFEENGRPAYHPCNDLNT